MKLDLSNIYPFLVESDIDQSLSEALTSLKKVTEKTGEGSDFLGWTDIPFSDDFSLGGYKLADIKAVAEEIREKDATLVCIGIGGSYLGHKAVIEALRPYTDKILYAGQNISSDHLKHILDVMDERENVYLNPISKSGTTTEPGIAFRVLRKWMEDHYNEKEAARRIVATTDANKGALRDLADSKGYRTFPIPDDVGGRFSVLASLHRRVRNQTQTACWVSQLRRLD